MAQNVTEVFRAEVPSVGLVLKARGDIRGKQEEYAARIREDFPGDGEALLTEYSANADCTFRIEGDGREGGAAFAAGGAPVKGPPAFFETRYFFRGDFRAVTAAWAVTGLWGVGAKKGVERPGGAGGPPAEAAGGARLEAAPPEAPAKRRAISARELDDIEAGLAAKEAELVEAGVFWG